MSSPTVSVITSNRNCARFLQEHIASVQKQTFADWEHVIYECSSTDASPRILREFGHPKLRVIPGESCGVSLARNRAIAQSRGEILCVLDADDMAFPERLARQVAFLQANPDVCAVGSGVVIWNEATGATRPFSYPTDARAVALLLEAGYSPVPHSTLAMRRSAFEAAGGYAEYLDQSEDFDLIARLAKRGAVRSLPEPLVRYTVRADSLSAPLPNRVRKVELFSALSMLVNAQHDCITPAQRSQLRTWLESVEPHGVQALRCRWAWRVLRKNNAELRGATFWRVAKLAAYYAPGALRCCRERWWKHADSPWSLGAYLLAQP